jgi:nitrate reductase gamma subunit
LESWIEFGRGPLFRIAFAVMLLGLARIFVLTIIGVLEAYGRSPDKIVNWSEVRKQTIAWLFPVNRLWRQRPVYSTISFLFHVGLLLVPVFLAAHVLLWKRAVGFGWPALPQRWANDLTVMVVMAGVALFLGRVLDPGRRKLSRRQDLAWPLLLVAPFITGYVQSNLAIGARTYDAMMLAHVYSADLIMLLIPFTKIAHCVLVPLSQVVTAVAWKFPAGAGDRVAATLGYADRPTWIKDARLSPPTTAVGVPRLAARITYSLVFITVAALGFGLLHVVAAGSRRVEPTPVHQARGGDVLWIDGNLDGFGVAFKHAEHMTREGVEQPCVQCHHMNVPGEEETACSRCHRDMYLPSDSFRHDWHASPAGGRLGCYQCHAKGQVRTAATSVACDKCHKNLIPAGASIKVKQYRAVAYTEAMHRLCIGCHVKKAKENKKPEMTRCAWCHMDRRDVIDARGVALRRRGLMGQEVVLPPGEAGR